MFLHASNHSKVNDKKKKTKQKRHEIRNGLVGRKVGETVHRERLMSCEKNNIFMVTYICIQMKYLDY